jgi:hypothetical protein
MTEPARNLNLLSEGNAVQQPDRLRNIRLNSDRQDFQERIRKSEWLRQVSLRLDELCALDTGWDGYSSEKVRFSTADFVNQFLQEVYFDGLPTPALVPSADGGIQVEWVEGHANAIEALVDRPNHMECFVAIEGHDEQEFVCRSDFQLLKDALELYKSNV